MASFNDCESLHEIEITPEQLRIIANEMERKTKSDLFQLGQIVRYKIMTRYCFIYRPEKPIIPTPKDVETKEHDEPWSPPSYEEAL